MCKCNVCTYVSMMGMFVCVHMCMQVCGRDYTSEHTIEYTCEYNCEYIVSIEVHQHGTALDREKQESSAETFSTIISCSGGDYWSDARA